MARNKYDEWQKDNDPEVNIDKPLISRLGLHALEACIKCLIAEGKYKEEDELIKKLMKQKQVIDEKSRGTESLTER